MESGNDTSDNGNTTDDDNEDGENKKSKSYANKQSHYNDKPTNYRKQYGYNSQKIKYPFLQDGDRSVNEAEDVRTIQIMISDC